MVAFFTGLGTGLERGSAATLGRAGLLGSSSLGRGAENVFVNAATGNLVLQRQDEFLVGKGPDLGFGRTYNALGNVDGDSDGVLDINSVAWGFNAARRVHTLTGTQDTTGSTITRRSGDGAEIVYTWNSAANAYLSKEGGGAYDTLTYASGVWTWTDGDSGVTESYAAHSGSWRISAQTDRDGNALTFAYDGSGRIASVTTEDNSSTTFTYDGSGNLTSVTVAYEDLETSTPVTYSRTSYAYTSGKLTKVTLEVEPAAGLDPAVLYEIEYTYNGAGLISKIEQTDGSSLEIDYDADGRVIGLEQLVAGAATRVTAIEYFSGYTEITDPAGGVTTLRYETSDPDFKNQLLEIETPAAQVVEFEYDASDGDVIAVTSVGGGVTTYDHDSHGNVIEITDPNNNVTERLYNSDNQLVRETRTGSTASSSSTDLHTRYVYDTGTGKHLRFAISAAGHVTEYVYDGDELSETIQYARQFGADAYTLGDTVPSLGTMTTWRAGEDLSGAKITSYCYDARGAVTLIKRWGAASSGGVGSTANGYSEEHFVYDQAGRLLASNVTGEEARTFLYDGLGRLKGSTNLGGGSTEIVFNDAATTTAVTTSDGYTSVSTFNKAGELIERTDSGYAIEAGGVEYLYDKLGRVRVAIATVGWTYAIGYTPVSTYSLFNEKGLKVADVGHGGEVIEYRYDDENRLIATGRYFNATGALSQLVDPDDDTLITDIRPTASSFDVWDFNVYDDGGRLIETIGGNGSVTTYAYDEADRLVLTRGYVNKLSGGTIAGFIAGGAITYTTPTADSAHDVIVRSFYDEDGRLIGTLNATGGLNQIFYDGAGQKIAETAYADETNSSYRASGTFAVLLGSLTPDAGQDVTTRYVYDGQGLLRYQIDALRRVTELVYHDGTLSAATGLVRKTIVYATPLASVADYDYATVANAIDTDAADRHSYAVYNDRQQLIYSVDASGAVTGFAYDAFGRVIKQLAYAETADLSALDDDEWAAELDELEEDADSRISRSWYNSRGELLFFVDAEGYITRTVYDGAGRIFGEYLFAEKVTVSDSTLLSSLFGLTYGQPVARARHFRHDAAGRLVMVHDDDQVFDLKGYYANGLLAWEIDGFWDDRGQTNYLYDQSGNRIQEIRYASAAAFTSPIGASATQLANYQRLRSSNTQYSALVTFEGELIVYHNGEPIWTSGFRESVLGASYRVATGVGGLTVYRMLPGVSDVAVWTSGAATGFSGPVTLTMRNDGNLVLANAGGDIFWESETDGVTGHPSALESFTVNYAYNGLGQLVSVTDGNGETTSFEYDQLGRMTEREDALDNETYFEYDLLGAATKTIDALGNISYVYTDQLGRTVLAIDAEGYATVTTYTVFGEVGTVKRFYTATTGASLSSRPTPAGDVAITSFEYDRLSRVVSTEDAEGGEEVYTLDVFGQRITVENKLEGLTHYTYDRRGLVTSKTVEMDVYNAAGSVVATEVTTTYEYDDRGNLVTLTEAAGLAEERVTEYEYDDHDRLLRTIGPEVDYVDSATDASTTADTPIVENLYDIRGNLVEQIDANGARTLYWYDQLRRRTHEMNAGGTLTRLYYDNNGNVIERRVYATTFTLPTDVLLAPPSGDGVSFRKTLYEYDALNRLTKTIVPGVTTAVYTTTLSVDTDTDLETTYVYDALGNVVSETDANGRTTYSWYDALGRKTNQIDAERYRTDWEYDADGNVTLERRYATQYSILTSFATLPSEPSSTDDDRLTTFTYDLMGRRLTETRHDVLVHNGSGGTSEVDAVITYTYNALGQVLTKEEATDETRTYVYDDQGRLIAEEGEAYTDYEENEVAPRIEYFYNGLDALSRLVQVGSSDIGGVYVEDRVTRYAYGAGGRLESVTDPVGLKRLYFYDLGGQVLREEYNRFDLDSSPAAATEAIGYEYDVEGRIVAQGAMLWDEIEPSVFGWTRDLATIDTRETTYNAFGEIVGRGVNGVVSEEFAFDDAGRMWRTTAGDGVWKYILYDGVGNATVAITSVGADIADEDLGTIIALWTAPDDIATDNVTGVAATITRYDGRNQAVEVLEPKRQRASATTDDVVTTRVYNAFGEVASEVNALGAEFDYSYNTMGRLIRTESPAIEARGSNGKWISGYTGFTPLADSTTATTFRPVEHLYYDASGRQVASRDANGNLTRYSLLAGTGYGGSQALVTYTLAPDSGESTIAYDVHGDARVLTDQIGRITRQTFDAGGRVIEVERPWDLDLTTKFTEFYAYDGLGQRIEHWNNLLGDTNAETTEYDHQGRIVEHVAMGGDTTTYTYAWSDSIETDGMGTFGGWTQTTTYANGKSVTDKSDVFGRAVQRTNMASTPLVSDFTYDLGGRLTQRSGGDALNYTYFNTGRLATSYSTTSSVTRTATYGYDKLGNVTLEQLTSGAQQWQNATASYDALGRMVSWSEAGSTSTPAASLTYAYDANGNIRRSYAVFHAIEYDGDFATGTTSQDYWYLYDAMNRVTTQKGMLVGTSIARGGGVDLAYDAAGQRLSATSEFADSYLYNDPEVPNDDYQVPFENTRIESYTYDDGGRLLEVHVAEGSYVADHPSYYYVAPDIDDPAVNLLRGAFTYDAMGRMLTQTDYGGMSAVNAFYSRELTYNAKSQVTEDTSFTRQGGTIFKGVTTYTYGSGGTYALGSPLTIQTVNYEAPTSTGVFVEKKTTKVTNGYDWADGAVQTSIEFDEDLANLSNPTNTSTYDYITVGGQKVMTQANILDGRAFRFRAMGHSILPDSPRTATFRNDLNGQVIKRDEADAHTTGDAHEVWFRFAGKQIGYVGNNGTSDVDYRTSTNERVAGTGSGPYRNGSTSSVAHADFDQSLAPINSYSQGSSGGAYSVRQGDTLQSIAAGLWGDSSLWYKIAEANGLSGQAVLIEGQSLVLPTGVQKNTHSAQTFNPYDPSEVLGDTSPTRPKPQKQNNCGVLGKILLVVIAVVVAWQVAPHAIAAIANMAPGVQGVTAAAITTAMEAGAVLTSIPGVSTAAVIGGGAIAGAAGSIVSQGVGVATGIQEKFSWNAVAMAAISGGVGGGMGLTGMGPISRALTGNVATQGVALATGLQSKFDWAGVAAAAAGSWAGGQFNDPALSIGASMIADAAARSVIDGSDFGDNILAALPNLIGQTIGAAIANASRPSAVADRITDQIRADLGPNVTQEQLLALDDFERQATDLIRDARRREGSDPSGADQLMGEVLSGAYSFYPDAEIDAMRGLIGHRSTLVANPEDFAVTSQSERFGGNAFGLLDRPSIYAGRLKDRVDTAVSNWVENTPGAGLALTTINWSLMIAGGVPRLAAAGVYGAAQEQVEAAATQRFRDVEYAEQTSYHGGSGISWLGETALTGLHFRRPHGYPRGSTTRPNGRRGDIQGNLSGRVSVAGQGKSWETARNENEIAIMFANDGYRVEQNAVLSSAQRQEFGLGPHRNPDYMIEGRPFDLITSTSPTPRNIRDEILGKVNPHNRQADRIVVDLRGSSVTRAELQQYMRDNPIAGLQELRVVHDGWFGTRIGQGL